ncbi:TPA: gp58-like family protein [Streptococcus suis]
MLTFLDHKGNEIGALTTFNYTNSVNGERSLSGTVHGNLEIEKGWGVRFEDEYYKVIYAKPKSLGKINIVQFDAVHQFFWDFDKSSVYSELDGSYPFQTFLDHIFNGSGYRYNLEVEVGSLRKQNFGLKKRLELFNDLIKHAGVEFRVRGKVVRILERTGTDLSTVVRKKLNLNDLSIEKRIGDFITYQKGLGAWHDENDHSKGRLEVEYVSPLAAIYGRLEGEPYVDERFTIAENFLGVLKKSVEDSYSISVQLAMEDLQKAGYRYTRPLAGDYITVIDEDINFKERVRIVSFETKYDIKGQVIDHTITCNDIGSVKKQSAGYSSLKSSVANVSKETESAIQTANRALVSADGKTTVYFGTEFPQDIPKGTLTKGDTLYLEVGDTTKMYYWNGAEWLEPPVVNDVEAFKESINTEIAQVNQSMQVQSEEHDRQVADILSKTQSIESLANQAKSDAANAIARANQVKTEAIADARAQVATVSQALNTAKSELQSAIVSADQKARDIQASATVLRNDLNLQASKILEQARAQTALTSRVTSVETLADGTRSTVAELSKTVNKATGDIASVSSRTKTVEDTLSQTRTQYEALSQTVNAQTGQIESINRKTADLQSGIDGVTERFENLRVGGTNLFKNSDFSQGEKNWHKLPEIHNEATGKYVRLPAHLWRMAQFVEVEQGEDYVISLYAKKISESSSSPRLNIKFDSLHNEDTDYVEITKTAWKRFVFKFRAKKSGKELVYFLNRNGIEVDIKNIKMEKGLLATDYSPSYEDYRSEIATYKRTAEESSAELSRQIQLADGKAIEAKTYAQQTADAINTRLESLETYKNEEGTRASQYLTASRTETAKQITAERAAIANDYVAKSTYDENVRGTTLKLNEIKTTADTAKQNLATYQNTVDRKLTELISTTQTLDGKINTASAKVDTVAGQIRTEISEVEGKIPTEIGGRNYVLDSDVLGITSTNKDFRFSFESDLNILRGKSVIVSTYIDVNNFTSGRIGFEPSVTFRDGTRSYANLWYNKPNTVFKGRIWTIWKIPDKEIAAIHQRGFYNQTSGGTASGGRPKLEIGITPTDWSPAPEDINDELSSVKTTITQTASGVEQLSTSLTTTDNKVTTAEAKIRQLISDVSSKVSQTDYNTLTGRVDSAETAITQNATEISKRLTSTQVNQAILADKQIKDTRNDNQSPQWYWSNYPKQTVEEFKKSTVIGLFGESTFVILTTNVQWDNSTGGKVKQTAKTDRATFERYGTGTLWDPWVKIANSSDLANYTTKTEFQTVKETTSLYERIIGSTETGIKDKVARMVMADSLFLTEVKDKISGTATQVSQLAGSYAIQNLTSSGTVLNQLNLNKDGSVKIDGKLVQITGTTYIQDGVIASAKIAGLDAGKITTGTLNAARIKANSIDGSKIVFDQAFLNKMTANKAYLRQLFAKDAFITQVQAVSLSASQIIGGLMRATNGAMEIDFNNSAIDMFKDGAIRFHSGSNAIYRQSTNGIHTAFVHFDTTSKGGIYASLGSTSSRDGINSKSSGRFAGIRVARTSERSDSHVASQDAVELYGDTIFFGHGFEGGGFSMHTTLTGGQTISLNKMHDALINLCRCWIHLRNEGFNLNSSAFRRSLDIEIHNAQQLYNTIERIT